MADLNTCHMTSKCNNCIHKPVCSKYIAIGEVNSCEHHKEERKGKWVRCEVWGQLYWECPYCKTMGSPHWKVCPVCTAVLRGNENG